MADTQTLQSRQPKETLPFNHSRGGEQAPREDRVTGGAITNFHNPTPRLPGEENKSLEPPRTVMIKTGGMTLQSVEDLFGNESGIPDYSPPNPQQLDLNRKNQLAQALGHK